MQHPLPSCLTDFVHQDAPPTPNASLGIPRRQWTSCGMKSSACVRVVFLQKLPLGSSQVGAYGGLHRRPGVTSADTLRHALETRELVPLSQLCDRVWPRLQIMRFPPIRRRVTSPPRPRIMSSIQPPCETSSLPRITHAPYPPSSTFLIPASGLFARVHCGGNRNGHCALPPGRLPGVWVQPDRRATHSDRAASSRTSTTVQ